MHLDILNNLTERATISHRSLEGIPDLPTQHAAPIVLKGLEKPFHAKRLARLRQVRGNLQFPEELLQSLIEAHPEMLPVEELEPSFAQLRSVCRELRLGRDETKYLDNLLINPDGRICLVECKLWRNPEAVRNVVAQVLDYAGELSCLSYEELCGAVRRALHGDGGDVIADCVLGPDANDHDRANFHDAVTRSLRLGNFLLLIVGDGIRAGLQQIAGLLQNRATLGFSLGLVEMAIYRDETETGPYYVQPRLLLQTEVVTRTVFVAGGEREVPAISEISAPSKPQTLTEQDFYSELAKADPAYPEALRGFLDRCEGIGVEPELLRTFVLRVDLPESSRVGPNLGTISRTGAVEIWLWSASGRDKRIGGPVARQYMERVAEFLGLEASIKQPKPDDGYVSYQGRASIPLSVMLQHEDAWLAAIEAAVQQFHSGAGTEQLTTDQNRERARRFIWEDGDIEIRDPKQSQTRAS